MICLVKHPIEHEENSGDAIFLIRSTLLDIDVTLILLNAERNSNVLIDNGKGNNKKSVCINARTLTRGPKKAIVGLHAFTGTVHNSFFFQKSKMRYWKVAQDYLFYFSNLGK